MQQEILQRQAINFSNKPGSKNEAIKVAKSLGGGQGLHHHFSDDEEEDEEANEALIDVAELNIIPPIDNPEVIADPNNPQATAIEVPKPNFISVTGPDGEDLI